MHYRKLQGPFAEIYIYIYFFFFFCNRNEGIQTSLGI